MSETVTIDLPLEAIRAFFEAQPIRRLSVFGSAARNELTPESDIDLLVEYEPEAPVGYFSMARHMRQLSEIVGRPVDLCTRNGLKDYIRREVDASARLIYERRNDNEIVRNLDSLIAAIDVVEWSASNASVS